MSSQHQTPYLIWQLKNLTLSINKSLDNLLQQEGLTLSQARVLLLLFTERNLRNSRLCISKI